MEYCSFPSFSCSFSSSSFSSSVSPVSPSSSSSSSWCICDVNVKQDTTALTISGLWIRTLGSPQQPACHRHWSSRSFFYVGDTCFGYCLPAQHLMIITRILSKNSHNHRQKKTKTTKTLHTLSSLCFWVIGQFLRHASAVEWQPVSVEALHASSTKRGDKCRLFPIQSVIMLLSCLLRFLISPNLQRSLHFILQVFSFYTNFLETFRVIRSCLMVNFWDILPKGCNLNQSIRKVYWVYV